MQNSRGYRDFIFISDRCTQICQAMKFLW